MFFGPKFYADILKNLLFLLLPVAVVGLVIGIFIGWIIWKG